MRPRFPVPYSYTFITIFMFVFLASLFMLSLTDMPSMFSQMIAILRFDTSFKLQRSSNEENES